MLAERFPSKSLWPRGASERAAAQSQLPLFSNLQKAIRILNRMVQVS